MNACYLLLILLFAPASGFCQFTGADQHGDELIQDDTVTVVAQEENKKYNLTAVLYGINFRYGHYNEIETKIITYVAVRDNKSGVEVKYEPVFEGEKTIIVTENDAPSPSDLYFTNVWSPDEEYLVLPLGMMEGFSVFKANDALNNIKANKFFDVMKVGGSEGGWYGHHFENWENDSTFNFRAGLYGDKFAYKYDVKKSNLSCYRIKCEEFDIGKNIKGNVKPIKKGDIETLKMH